MKITSIQTSNFLGDGLLRSDYKSAQEMRAEIRRQGAEVERLRAELDNREGMVCGDCDGSGWLENRVEGRLPCTCMTEAEPYQLLQAKLAALEQDAARYREIRAQHEGNDAYSIAVFATIADKTLVPIGSLPGELDVFVDAVMRAKEVLP